jgi:hypothetical protein
MENLRIDFTTGRIYYTLPENLNAVAARCDVPTTGDFSAMDFAAIFDAARRKFNSGDEGAGELAHWFLSAASGDVA